MRLIASLVIGLLLLSACTSAEADADADGRLDPGAPGGDAVVDDEGAAGAVVSLPPRVAVSAALQDARSAPSGQWSFTTGIGFLGGEVLQGVAAVREYDRNLLRSRLRVAIDLADSRVGDAEVLTSAFADRTTEVIRSGDDVFVRMSGPATDDEDWYELGDAPLDGLVAWDYLFVDPLGERLPLVGLIEGDGVEIGDPMIAVDGTATYPIRLDGTMVLERLRDEAPALTGWLPAGLDPSEIDTVAAGTVRLDAEGTLLDVQIDLGPTVAEIAQLVDDEFDREFYSSAEAQLSVVFDQSGGGEITVPPASMVVEPAPIVDDEPASELGVGDCMPPGTDLRQGVLKLVRCDDAHTFEVFLVTEGWDVDADYPGRAEVRDHADEVCVAGFEDFVGVRFVDSIHSVAAISPLPEGWDEGNRTIVCLTENYLPHRGTLAGAAE